MQLVFIAGALRSGSTLLRLMLDRHSGILNPKPGEHDYVFDALGTDGGLAAANQLSAQAFDAYLLGNRNLDEIQPHMPAQGSTADRLRGHVQGFAHLAPTLALCLHRNFVSALELFPQARFIHLLRDPRDCAKSAVAIGFAGNCYHGLGPWLDAELSWERVKPRLRADQFIELRYEDLVAAPQEHLTRICEFLGLQYEPAMLDLSGTTYDTPSPRFANQWKRHMSARDIRLVEARAGALMPARGYEMVNPGQRLGRFTLLGLRLQNMLARHRDGIRLYGLSLWVQEITARHLGLQAWLHAVHQRMFPIKIRTLK